MRPRPAWARGRGRTEAQALARGAPGDWTWDDTEAARQEANAACVARRETSPTRAAVWAAREPLGAGARAAFQAEVLRQQQGPAPAEATATATAAEVSGGDASDKACPWRVVLRRALVALGDLVFSWRRIPLQVKAKKTAKITWVAHLTYTYDQADRATALTINGATDSYSYDATNELTSDGVATYSYDATGNRTTVVYQTGVASYQTGAGNQMTNDGTFTYTYDADGNVVKKSKGASAETWTYGYDNRNQMIWAQDRATDGGTLLSVATYTCDVTGRLIEEDQTVGTTTTVTRHAWDSQDSWADLNGSTALLMRYLHGDQVNQLLAQESGSGTVYWYETDRLQSVIGLVNASGAPQVTVAYDGFGNETSDTNLTLRGPYGYTGALSASAIGF